MSKIDIEYVSTQLGPEGPGFAVLESHIPVDLNHSLHDELTNMVLPWVPQYNNFVNKRGIEVDQAFDVFAHKFSRGDQQFLDRVPAFLSFSEFVMEQVVEPLSVYFPSLQQWELDELSAQRYIPNEGHLTWHKDLARHPGIIAISNIVGKAEIAVRHDMTETTTILNPGDVALLRAPGLFKTAMTAEEISPEHAVRTVMGTEQRISVTARANNSPDVPIENFYYHNWGPQPDKD